MPTQHIVLPATPREIWQLFTTDAVADWLMPGMFAKRFTADLRNEGEWLYGDPDGSHLRGRYLHYEPYSRLHYMWSLGGTFAEDEMEFRFAPVAGGTEVTLSYPDGPSAEADDEQARTLLMALQQALAARVAAH